MIKNTGVINFKKTPYIIAEIGINHNGYISLAKKMILEAKKKYGESEKINWLDGLGTEKHYDYVIKNENTGFLVMIIELQHFINYT